MKRNSDSGVALISAMLVLMLMSGLLVGFVALVTTDQHANSATRDQTQAYAAAHAGVEKLTADLGQLFRTNFKPTGTQISALVTTDKRPNLGSGMNFTAPGGGSGYTISFTDLAGGGADGNSPDGNPDIKDPNGSPIPDGPYEGLIGLITPYNVTVTARTAGNSEVRMRREMQTIAIPVFQFGIFSDNDLAFFAGPSFAFGGRLHTNQSLYLKQDSSPNVLTLSDRVTAVREIIRSHLQNGTHGSHTSTVRVARASGCPGTAGSCRDLLGSESSIVLPASSITTFPLIPTTPTKYEPWENLSLGHLNYNSWMRTGATGAKPLVLPIVDPDSGSTPIDLIKRPKSTDDSTSNTHKERFFHLGSIRILLSDTAAEIKNLPTVNAASVPIALHMLDDAGGIPLAQRGSDSSYRLRNRDAANPPDTDPGDGDRNPIHYGYILIEKKTNNEAGPWTDVTMAFLNKGVTGRNQTNGANDVPHNNAGTCGLPGDAREPNPEAIIRIQHVRDEPTQFAPCGMSGADRSLAASDYWPNVLWDPREGALRDSVDEASQAFTFAGLMHYVELDVRNLRKWMSEQTDMMKTTGYVVYFSDRRGNKNAAGVETGEFGFEDVVNLDDELNGLPNGSLEVGEDINPNGLLDDDEDTNGNDKLDPGEDVGNGLLETYGNTPRYPTPNGITGFVSGSAFRPTTGAAGLFSPTLTRAEARRNPTIFFRRALKLVNGNRDAMVDYGYPEGLTIASENPVYIQGDYNAKMSEGAGVNPLSGTYTQQHVATAVIADAVTMLSNKWNDLHGFLKPYDTASGTPRTASNTVYRVAIISGKGRAFPRPDDAENHPDYGTDGGAHNFLRYIERWSNLDLNYRGSLVSLYFSRQAVGTYKCCDHVYQPPARKYYFDEEFKNPNKLPPRTPMFREINTLTFRQILRPTEQ